MLHACVQIFNVTGILKIFGTKHGLKDGSFIQVVAKFHLGSKQISAMRDTEGR
jgi:hypothetical protein